MLNDFELLETILYAPDRGFYLLEEHLSRLQKAIANFKESNPALFLNPPTSHQIEHYLNENVPKDGQYQRVRLLLDTNSNLSVESTSLSAPLFSHESLNEAASTEPIVSVVLDSEPFTLAHDDLFVLNKTTRRDMYNLSRERTQCDWHADMSAPFDVILWNKDKQVTETSITNIAVQSVDNDKVTWKTPRLDCGVLPGVFRSFLLSKKEMVEDVVTLDDLLKAEKENRPIVCFNSVRKAYRVKLLAV